MAVWHQFNTVGGRTLQYRRMRSGGLIWQIISAEGQLLYETNSERDARQTLAHLVRMSRLVANESAAVR